MIQCWTADKIRSELKSGKLPLVQKRGTEYSNLGAGTAIRLEGTYSIEVKKYEIVVDMFSQVKAQHD